MGLEQAIQNLADAIVGYTAAFQDRATTPARGYTAAASSSVTDDAKGVDRDVTAEQEAAQAAQSEQDAKAKAAAEKKLDKAKADLEAKKAAAAEAAKTPEPEVILAGEKTEAEVRDEAFNIENGYCTRPFLDLGKNGGRDQQAAILKEFGVARLSLVETDKIPALRTAILNAVAVASVKV